MGVCSTSTKVATRCNAPESELEPSDEALERHVEACEAGKRGYVDPDSGLFVMTSVYLRERGECCGSGCRHCPYSPEEQEKAGRPDVPTHPWP